MVRVVLADDEEFVRLFLRSVMASLSFKVVAEVGKGNEVFYVMKETNPDILFLDINMPNLTGIEFLKRHSKEFPKTCIIILTSSTSFKLIEEAIAEGISCFMRKDLPIDQMIPAIKKTWSNFKKGNRTNV